MIEPIKPGDALFPYDINYVEGKAVCTRRKDWNTEKQIDLRLRTLDYLMQFEENWGSVALIRMIEAYETTLFNRGTGLQNERMAAYVILKDQWLTKTR